jgi:hypothetical protein
MKINVKRKQICFPHRHKIRFTNAVTCICWNDLAYKIGIIKLNMTDYEVITPDHKFKEKGYTDWIQDWSNWFYQPYPERNNDGDVVFLRSTPLSEGNYQNEACVMIGNESLEISEDQHVLVPIITATFIADENESPEWMYGMARGNISEGDNPPDVTQLKINGEAIDIGGDKDFDKYEFETPVYQIYIPDAPPGVSLKHQVEMPIESSGYFSAVTRGYFVILKLKKGGSSKGDFYIHCEASGATTPRGPYDVSLFYHIMVTKTPKGRGPRPLPKRLTRNIAIKVLERLGKGQITGTEFDKIKEILGEGHFLVKEDGLAKIERILKEIVETNKMEGVGTPPRT